MLRRRESDQRREPPPGRPREVDHPRTPGGLEARRPTCPAPPTPRIRPTPPGRARPSGPGESRPENRPAPSERPRAPPRIPLCPTTTSRRRRRRRLCRSAAPGDRRGRAAHRRARRRAGTPRRDAETTIVAPSTTRPRLRRTPALQIAETEGAPAPRDRFGRRSHALTDDQRAVGDCVGGVGQSVHRQIPEAVRMTPSLPTKVRCWTGPGRRRAPVGRHADALLQTLLGHRRTGSRPLPSGMLELFADRLAADDHAPIGDAQGLADHPPLDLSLRARSAAPLAADPASTTASSKTTRRSESGPTWTSLAERRLRQRTTPGRGDASGRPCAPRARSRLARVATIRISMIPTRRAPRRESYAVATSPQWRRGRDSRGSAATLGPLDVLTEAVGQGQRLRANREDRVAACGVRVS